VSSHPLDQFAAEIGAFGTVRTDEASARPQDAAVILGALVKQVRPVVTKKGDRMAILTVEDAGGVMDAVLFPRTFAEESKHLMKDTVVFLAGRLDHQRGDPQVIVERVIPAERVGEVLTSRVEIEVDAESMNGSAEGMLRQLRGVLEHSGYGLPRPDVAQAGVSIVLRASVGENGCARRRRVVLEPRGLTVRPTAQLCADVERVAGLGSVRLRGGLPGWLTEAGGGRRGAGAQRAGSFR